MITTIEELIRSHVPVPDDTLACYKCFKNETWEDRDPNTGELKGILSYFYLDFPYDMIIAIAKDNKFSKSQWKILLETCKDRSKAIRINSDQNNPALHKAAAKVGGYFIGDEIYLPPINKEK